MSSFRQIELLKAHSCQPLNVGANLPQYRFSVTNYWFSNGPKFVQVYFTANYSEQTEI